METEPLVLARRYQLVSPLGSGGHGSVWEARDLLLGDTVAVKCFDRESFEPARVRREIAALRLLRLPGVVQLLDEGTDHGRPFFVMERVAGAPFPGLPIPLPWDALAPRVFRLLEVLAGVHAHSVVHRDLKPANVLVTAAGQITLLDFGIASGAALGSKLTRTGAIVGTPDYLAPEQLRGDAIGPWTDLYAAGVMLYQALSGTLPHAFSDLRELMQLRLRRPPAPLAERAPAVPAAVAQVVDALLAIRGEARPRSATAVLHMLAAETSVPAEVTTLPRLGGDAPVEAVIAALDAGQAVDLVGPPGSGRSRCIAEARARLERHGRHVISLARAQRPLASLAPVVDGLDVLSDAPLATVRAHARAAVRAHLADGLILVADDVDALDRVSQDVLAQVLRDRDAGALLRVFSAEVPGAAPTPAASDSAAHGPLTIPIEPLDEAALRLLFAGPDRVFHLREDAARMLWQRSEGLAARVVEEVTDWVRAGMAHWDGDLLGVDRDALDRLAAEPRAGFHGRRPAPPGAIPERLDELYAWITFAGPHAEIELLAQVLGARRWEVEADLDELAATGAIRRLAAGRVAARFAVFDPWSDAQRQSAHRQMAALLPAGTPQRLFHLVAGEDLAAPAGRRRVADEAITQARQWLSQGYLGRATRMLDECLRALRRASPDRTTDQAETDLLAQWVEVVLAEPTAPALDRVLYEMDRCEAKPPALSALEDLAHAALAALTTGGEHALLLANAVPAFDDVERERMRQEVRVTAARRCVLAREEATVDEAGTWAHACGDTHAQASAAGWLGRLRYRQGRFDEAAALQARAVAGELRVVQRIAAMLHAASALMEEFRLREAAAQAGEARALAERYRQVYFEARAEWLLRASAYRLGETTAVDTELVDVVARVGVVELEALVCFTEAAVAWRLDDLTTAAALAARAHDIWKRLGMPWSASLALGLTVAAEPGHEVDTLALAQTVARCPIPGLGIQTLGLLARRWPEDTPRPLAAAAVLARQVPEAHWDTRMDVLSVAEAMALVGVPRAS